MKKLTSFVSSVTVLAAPIAAYAGDGGGMDGAGALLIKAVGRLIGKLSGMF